MELLFVTTSFPRYPGDHAGNFVLKLAQHLSRTFSVRVLVPDFPGSRESFTDIPVSRFTYFRPVRYQSLAYRMGIAENIRKNPFLSLQIPGFLAAMYGGLKRHITRETMIISHWLLPCSWISGEIREQTGARHIAIGHGGDVYLLSRLPFGTYLANRIIARCDALIVVARYMMEKLLTLAWNRPALESKMHVIPMGCDPFAPHLDRPFRHSGMIKLLFIGRLIALKGVRNLLQALVRMPAIELHIAGDGPESGKLREFAATHHLNVIFHGWVSGSPKEKLFRDCDLAVFPSLQTQNGRMEGVPVSILESLAAGIPVIATTTGGIPDVIRSGENGWLIPPGDVSALTDAIRTLAGNPELRHRLSVNAAASSEKYHWTCIASQYETIISQKINQEK